MALGYQSDGYCWVRQVELPAWAGFRAETDTFVAVGDYAASDGTVELVFAPEGRDLSPLTAEELALIERAIASDEQACEAILEAVFRQYPAMQESYGYGPDEQVRFMPDISSPADLKHLLSPSSMNVHQIEKDGVPYVGYGFGCTWDVEHGLGVLIHGTRCVDLGGSDTAFLLWICKTRCHRGLNFAEYWQFGSLRCPLLADPLDLARAAGRRIRRGRTVDAWRVWRSSGGRSASA